MKMKSQLLKRQEKGAIKGIKYKAFTFLLKFLTWPVRMIFICCLMLLPAARRFWGGSGDTQRHQKDSPEATGFPFLFNTGGWEVRLGLCSSHSPAAPAHCRWGTPKCVTTSTCWDGLGVCGEGECVAKPPMGPALCALTLVPQGGDHSRHALLQVALGHFTWHKSSLDAKATATGCRGPQQLLGGDGDGETGKAQGARGKGVSCGELVLGK